MDNFSRKICNFMIVYGIVWMLIMVLFKTAFMLSIVPTESMEGTIKKGDLMISTCYDVGADDLKRYDILIFTPPDRSDQTYVKRLIGLPGETIKVSNGKVYADGIELDDSFVDSNMNNLGDGVFNVPEGCYFFLGDNRDNSNDSRFWVEKFVPLDNILSKVKLIL